MEELESDMPTEWWDHLANLSLAEQREMAVYRANQRLGTIIKMGIFFIVMLMIALGGFSFGIWTLFQPVIYLGHTIGELVTSGLVIILAPLSFLQCTENARRTDPE